MTDLWDLPICSIDGPTPASIPAAPEPVLPRPAAVAADVAKGASRSLPAAPWTLAQALEVASQGRADVKFALAGTSGGSERNTLNAETVMGLHAVLGLSTESREFAVEGGTIYMSGAPTLVAVKPPGPAEASRPEAFFSSAPEAPPAPTPPDVAHHLVFDPESSPAFKHEVRSALAYLARAPGTASLVSRLDRGPNTVTLQESAWLDDDFAAFDPDTGTIAFNPHLGLQSAGGVIPPALILAHELGHAEEFGAHELRACIEAELEDPVFGTATERRNCLEVEFPIAAQLDLPLNVDRTALVIPVECSTCKK